MLGRGGVKLAPMDCFAFNKIQQRMSLALKTWDGCTLKLNSFSV